MLRSKADGEPKVKAPSVAVLTKALRAVDVDTLGRDTCSSGSFPWK